MGVHCSPQDIPVNRRRPPFRKQYLKFLRLVQIMVADRHRHDSVPVNRHRFLDGRFAFPVFLQITFDQFRSLMMLIHMKYMISRRQKHPSSFRQYHSLQNINNLGNTGHLYPVAMPVKNIQCHTGNKCIPHRILLIEETRIGTGLHIMPAPPLIDDHADLPVGIILIHDRSMSPDQFLHSQRTLQGILPFLFAEIRCASLMFPLFHAHIIVHGKSVHKPMGTFGSRFTETFMKHRIRPFIIDRIRTAADLENRMLLIIIPHISLISAI